MDDYKKEIQSLKELSKAWSVQDSQLCWEKFSSKRKGTYNECSKKAVISYYVFCQGKKDIKDLKKSKLKDCESLYDPRELYSCRESVYKEMIDHIHSLNTWIIRERDLFLSRL
jgi:hypothetical protein